MYTSTVGPIEFYNSGNFHHAEALSSGSSTVYTIHGVFTAFGSAKVYFRLHYEGTLKVLFSQVTYSRCPSRVSTTPFRRFQHTIRTPGIEKSSISFAMVQVNNAALLKYIYMT